MCVCARVCAHAHVCVCVTNEKCVGQFKADFVIFSLQLSIVVNLCWKISGVLKACSIFMAVVQIGFLIQCVALPLISFLLVFYNIYPKYE